MEQDPPTPSPRTPPEPAGPPPLRRAVIHLQDRIAAAFGVQQTDREAIVRAMLERTGRDSAGYYLQLLLAMGIASLGLVLGSTAVVIGAMLISPLMGPIIELGMGLAIGSPLLFLRSSVRVLLSIFAVVTSAALITRALPFNEVTAEIAARTAPTALDLLIAIFCAISAAYTTVRPGSDTTSTAAGTAIGISLVPPLCVVGYGVGTGARAIWGGAALLFTANFCAILLFAVLCFLALGYSAVSTVELEQAEIEQHRGGAIRRVIRGIQVFFGLRYGRLFRVLMPLVLLGSVYIPLRKALEEVTWQVRVRTAVERMLGALPQNTVRSSVSTEARAVSVRLVMLGSAEEAAKLEEELKAKIAGIAGVAPAVHVVAVPDVETLRELTAARAAAPPPRVEVAPREPEFTILREKLTGALAQAWPSEAGKLLAWRIEMPDAAPAVVDVVHLGPALGPAGAAMLGKELARRLDAPVSVRDAAVSPEPVVAEPAAGMAWLPDALRVLHSIHWAEALRACVEAPASARARPIKDAASVLAVLRATPTAEDGRLYIMEGARWSVVASIEPCGGASGADAGAPAKGPIPEGPPASPAGDRAPDR
jgi:uncharacterized hydrophobic protein (TIGR00271 family)